MIKMCKADKVAYAAALATLVALALMGVYVFDMSTGLTSWWATTALYGGLAYITRAVALSLIVKAGRIDWFV